MSCAPITAVEWRVGEQSNFQEGWDEIRVVERLQRDGTKLWAVIWLSRGRVLNHDGEWELEVQPSSRDAAYTQRCRWDDWAEAQYAAQRIYEMERRGWHAWKAELKSLGIWRGPA